MLARERDDVLGDMSVPPLSGGFTRSAQAVE
jgi:hypothetical protein